MVIKGHISLGLDFRERTVHQIGKREIGARVREPKRNFASQPARRFGHYRHAPR